ncbi:glutamyl-tRNA synthetase [Colletotrichum camelliae]|nr:glutamyl-tRNA synthetase [Colletotrichum camelliae]
MSTIALRPHSRSILQRSAYICQQCRVSSPRWHSSAKRTGGFEALRKKLPSLADGKLRDLPNTPARTRFAPSPTGYLHLGSLRTALFNWLIARATGGQFIIRVEDTDRSWIGTKVLTSAANLSLRLDDYNRKISQLLENGHAYRCFCSSHDLERHKQQSLEGGGTAHYPGTCRTIPVPEAERRAEAGEPHVVRFNAQGRRPSFVDSVYGNYQKSEDEDDFILIKTDGYPTYHFANVVDDHLMEITHVIRGAEWLISTPKHIALYDAFNWTPPTFAHAGLLCAQNGEKLSKRNHDIDISSYRERGILPSALNNWLALLGWSMSEKDLAKKDGEVIYTTQALAEKFSLRFTKGNIKTNPDKLAVIQRKHLTHRLREDPADDALLRRTIVPVSTRLLTSISDLLAAKKEEYLTNPTNHRHAFSTTDFSGLIPVLANPATAPAHILRVNRVLAADSPVDPLDLIYEHPSLFFRPSATAYARHTFSRSLSKLDDLKDYTGAAGPEALLVDLRASFEAVPVAEWGATRLQQVINDFSERHATEVAKDDGTTKRVKATKATYTLLRLVLTGDPLRGAKPAKLQLTLLGKEETLLRFDMCVA